MCIRDRLKPEVNQTLSVTYRTCTTKNTSSVDVGGEKGVADFLKRTTAKIRRLMDRNCQQIQFSSSFCFSLFTCNMANIRKDIQQANRKKYTLCLKNAPTLVISMFKGTDIHCKTSEHFRKCTLWGKKTAPFYFCHKFIKPSYILIFLAHIYPNKFAAK